jgi:hypothetical protein
LQDFVNFKSFLRKKAKVLLKEGSKGAAVDEDKFALTVNVFIIYMTKLLQSDWLRGVQLFH